MSLKNIAKNVLTEAMSINEFVASFYKLSMEAQTEYNELKKFVGYMNVVGASLDLRKSGGGKGMQLEMYIKRIPDLLGKTGEILHQLSIIARKLHFVEANEFDNLKDITVRSDHLKENTINALKHVKKLLSISIEMKGLLPPNASSYSKEEYENHCNDLIKYVTETTELIEKCQTYLAVVVQVMKDREKEFETVLVKAKEEALALGVNYAQRTVLGGVTIRQFDPHQNMMYVHMGIEVIDEKYPKFNLIKSEVARATIQQGVVDGWNSVASGKVHESKSLEKLRRLLS